MFTSLTSRALSGESVSERVSPTAAHLRPRPGPPCRDTYSGARGSLSSSFSVFASRTLWGEREEELRVVRWLEEEGRVGGLGLGVLGPW